VGYVIWVDLFLLGQTFRAHGVETCAWLMPTPTPSGLVLPPDDGMFDLAGVLDVFLGLQGFQAELVGPLRIPSDQVRLLAVHDALYELRLQD